MTRTMRLSPDAPALVHGLGLFETMRVVRGQVVQRDAHFERMAASARALGFPACERRAFDRAVDAAAASGEAALRCSYVALTAGSWKFLATAAPLPETTLRRRRYGRVITLDDIQRSLPQHKLTSYAASVIGLRQATARGADEGLFVDRRGRILEGTATNVFAVDGKRLITAPVSAGLLPGIVRAWVLEQAKELGLRIIERPPTLDELRAGSFLTSSLTMIAPIRRVNGEACPAPDPIVSRLQGLYRKVV